MRLQLIRKGDRLMTKLNHINLAVSDVPELTRFFETGFNFRTTEQRGSNKFAVLIGEDGFALILMHDKNVAEQEKAYPGIFHVGFLVASPEVVREHYTRLRAAGFTTPEPAILQRGGGRTYGFYANAPGGVVVEVSTPAA
jgi:catechol 2,3-dioxygenase-like lactoylglutathione lyase family enzyme